MHLRSPPIDPLHKQGTDPGEPRQSYSNVPGQTGVDQGALNERTNSFWAKTIEQTKNQS